MTVTRGGFSAGGQPAGAADAALKMREGLALHQQGRTGEAERRYRDVLRQYPNHPDALQYLGVIEVQKGNRSGGLELLDRALKANPRSAAAHYNRANLLRDMNRLEEALGGYDAALKLNRQHAGALINRAAVLRILDRPAEALASLDSAIAVAPGEANAHHGRGVILAQMNRHDDAIASFGRALSLGPAKVETLIARGHALCRAGRQLDGLRDFVEASAGAPDNADVFFGQATALMELRRHELAVEAYDRARALAPGWIELNYGRASALNELQRHDEAIADFRALLAARPDYPYALGMAVHALNMSCDWSAPELAAQLIESVRQGKKAASPFALLEISDSPSDIRECARIVMRDKFEPGRDALWRGEIYHHDRIRLAYVSADLRAHPVGNLIAGVVEAHDRNQFELIAIAYTPDDGSATRQRLKRGFDRFVETGAMSDAEIARAMRELEIDIAVDLTGLTASCRPGILCHRPAPVQVNYLGYAGSMGSTRHDYVIGDATVIPDTHAAFYDEKIVRLPVPFLPIDASPPPQPGTIHSRADAGLPEDAFVFASFNNSFKFNPAMFDVWMRLLNRIGGSILWLPAGNAAAMRNLAAEAVKRGVAPERIRFAPRLPEFADHLARIGMADLFLDTLPYNAHSTAADALRSGLPVLTCRGKSFAGRVAASLLEAAGLHELIAESMAEYEERAMVLAQKPEELARIKTKLNLWRQNQGPAILPRIVRNLETAYREMWSRAQRGLPPDSFTIGAGS